MTKEEFNKRIDADLVELFERLRRDAEIIKQHTSEEVLKKYAGYTPIIEARKAMMEYETNQYSIRLMSRAYVIDCNRLRNGFVQDLYSYSS